MTEVCRLEKNLRLLENCASAATVSCIAASGSQAKLKAVQAKDGEVIFEYLNEAGEYVPSSSRRAAGMQAKRQLQEQLKQLEPDAEMAIVIGLCGTAFLQAVAEAVSEQTKIVIVDPTVECSQVLLKALDYDSLLKGERDIKLIAADREDAERIERELTGMFTELGQLKIAVFQDPALFRVCPEALNGLPKKITGRIEIEIANRMTATVYVNQWHGNQIHAIPYLASNPSLSVLRDKFADIPAVIAAAGPSLNRAIPFLKQIRSKVMLISVGTALKSLLAEGIKPDFTLALDSNIKTISQFEGVDPEGHDSYVVPDFATEDFTAVSQT